jgi:Leucine-rich repeat (LRR) protein
MLGLLTALSSLFLTANNLTSTLPTELGRLTKLNLMYLSANALTGTIPAEIASLSNLEIAYLSKNRLLGSVPSELCQLKNVSSMLLFVDCLEVVCNCSCYCRDNAFDDFLNADFDDRAF